MAEFLTSADQLMPAARMSIRQNSSPVHASTRQHSPAYPSTRQYSPVLTSARQYSSAHPSTRQHSPALASTRLKAPALGSTRLKAPAGSVGARPYTPAQPRKQFVTPLARTRQLSPDHTTARPITPAQARQRTPAHASVNTPLLTTSPSRSPPA